MPQDQKPRAKGTLASFTEAHLEHMALLSKYQKLNGRRSTALRQSKLAAIKSQLEQTRKRLEWHGAKVDDQGNVTNAVRDHSGNIVDLDMS